MKDRLEWGVIGTGGIATDFTQALSNSPRGSVVNVVGTSPEKARSFAERWSVDKASSSLEEFLADTRVEAVYVATPHPAHEAQAIACAKAGKHVLCEKPICVDAEKAERVIAVARENQVFLMEAFMYRCHPLIRALIKHLKDGAIGTLRHVRADFAFRVERDPKGRLFNLDLGGGGILDVGGYPVSFARLLAGLVVDKPFAEPTRLDAAGYRGPTGADELASALLTFESGFTAAVTCGVYHDAGTRAVIFGDQGKIILPDPWIPQGDRQALTTRFTVARYGEPSRDIEVKTDHATYALEAALVADTLPELQAPWPAMSWDDTLGNMRVLDSWRKAIR
jgi:predicted dehydrogenase